MRSLRSYEIYNQLAGRLRAAYESREHATDLEWIGRWIQPGWRIVDLGSGTGRDVEDLANRGLRAIGIDAADNMVRLAVELHGGRFLLADHLSLPFKEGVFDAIWSMSVLTLFDDGEKKKALFEIRRVLRKGGILYVAVWEGNGLYISTEFAPEMPRQHFLLPKSQWKRLLAANSLEVVEVRNEVVDVAKPIALKIIAQRRR